MEKSERGVNAEVAEERGLRREARKKDGGHGSGEIGKRTERARRKREQKGEVNGRQNCKSKKLESTCKYMSLEKTVTVFTQARTGDLPRVRRTD